jgi:hypothetical protein
VRTKVTYRGGHVSAAMTGTTNGLGGEKTGAIRVPD